MTAETISCNRCARAIPAEAAVYSSAGELICPACAKAAELVEADGRGASSLRRARLMLGGTAARLVLVPCAMYAAGLGQLIGDTLLVVGLGLMIGGISIPPIVARLRRDAHLTTSSIEAVVQGLPGGSARRFAAYLLVAGVVVATGGGFLTSIKAYRPRAERASTESAHRRNPSS